jgi:hypothetical protein
MIQRVRSKQPTTSAAPALERFALFGPPPLINGENPEDYNELLLRVSTAVGPQDAFEDLWVRDIVDHSYNIFRLRRYKAELMEEYSRDYDSSSFAFALAHNVDTFEPIDRMIASAEAGRNAALREMDRRRAMFGVRLRQTVEQIESEALDQNVPQGNRAA